MALKLFKNSKIKWSSGSFGFILLALFFGTSVAFGAGFYNVAFGFKPVGSLYITNPDQNGTKVSYLTVSSHTVSGLCPLAGGTVNITGSATGSTTCLGNGTWTANLNFSADADGVVSITAAEISRGVSVSATRTFQKVTTYCANPTNSSATPFAGGSGTTGSPYIICSTAQALALSNNSGYWGNNFQLQNDINLAGQTWTPVNFSGTTFDGNGFTMNNLTIVTSSDDAGLFYNSSGTIQNLGVLNVNISGGNSLVGGITGQLSGGSIINSYATGIVNIGGYHAGGLVGQENGGGNIISSWANVSVNGGTGVGGLVGHNYGGSITSSYSMGPVVGWNWVGGLSGANDSGSNIANCYSTSTVNAGGGTAGGLTGFNTGTIVTSYATGAVTGSTPLGGIDASAGTASNLYWDITTTGQATSAEGTGLTDAQMTQKSNFAGFDFTTPIWTFKPYLSKYPVLNWQ